MKKLFIVINLFLLFFSAKSQQNEYYFRFIESDKNTINTIITRIISIDRIDHDTVYAYANPDDLKRFEKLGYKYTLLSKPSLLNTKAITMATTVDQMATWDKYPTYGVYRAMMKKFEHDYPSLCKLDSIGTTNNSHKIYLVKLSKNVAIEEPEVEVFYTSTIHGDETTGFVLMLRLIDYLLSNYSVDAHVASMLNSMAIYINPVSNPDGTYYGGDNNVSGATRFNIYGVDLNRNFPDKRFGIHPDGHIWQTENQIMMKLDSTRHFTLSANFHGGAEVVNYPWDDWTSSTKIHPDNNWYIHVSRQFADSVHINGPAGYFTNPYSSGITEGGDWYVISGGRQDYMNFWHHCREVTIELSADKTPSADQLPNFWNYNRAALLSYIESATKGFSGIITDNNGNPLKAKVFISGKDADSSHVYSSSTTGYYARPIEPGTWQATYSAPGYISQTKSVIVNDWNSSTTQNVQLSLGFTVTFNIKNQGVAIANANVSFNGINQLTAANGAVVFSNIPYGTGYNYTVSLNGYLSVTGNVDVVQDKVVAIELTPVGIIVPTANKNILGVWPNPFSDEINISVNLEKPSVVNLSVYSIDGRKVITLANGPYPEGLSTFNGITLSKSINSGSYIVLLKVGEKSFSQIIQHIR